MKLISLLFLTLFFGKGCDKQQSDDMEKTVVQYEANTRGFYQLITIQNQTIKVTKDREGKDNVAAEKISDADWKELIVLFQKINLVNLENLKAPTERRFFDGAAIGNLKVTFKDKIYETRGFDHGKPPAEIEPLVTKIFSLVKTEENGN